MIDVHNIKIKMKIYSKDKPLWEGLKHKIKIGPYADEHECDDRVDGKGETPSYSAVYSKLSTILLFYSLIHTDFGDTFVTPLHLPSTLWRAATFLVFPVTPCAFLVPFLTLCSLLFVLVTNLKMDNSWREGGLKYAGLRLLTSLVVIGVAQPVLGNALAMGIVPVIAIEVVACCLLVSECAGQGSLIWMAVVVICHYHSLTIIKCTLLLLLALLSVRRQDYAKGAFRNALLLLAHALSLLCGGHKFLILLAGGVLVFIFVIDSVSSRLRGLKRPHHQSRVGGQTGKLEDGLWPREWEISIGIEQYQ